MRPILAAVSLVALAGCAAGLGGNPPITLEERFYQTAFYDEERGQEADRLYRWDWPLEVYIEGGADWERQAVRDHVTLLGQITGLPVEFTDASGAAFRVLFVNKQAFAGWLRADNARLRNTERAALCLVYLSGYGNRYRATAIIPDWYGADTTRRCIVEELTQALGLSYDLPGRTDTALSNGGSDRLTPADIALLKLLYNPLLRPGMSWAEAEPIVIGLTASAD